MTWREQLQPASFRGIAFEVETTEREGGRRTIVFEYPKSDRNEIEDLGDGAKRFSIKAYVLGNDYMATRDALEKALDTEGPGPLVLPTRGLLQVRTDGKYKTVENQREGGCAEFSIPFVVDQTASLPAARLDTQAQTQLAADAASEAAQSDFALSFLELTGIYADLSNAIVQDALAPIAAAVDAAYLAADVAYTQLVTAVLDPLASARSVLADLIAFPSDLASRVSGLIDNIASAADLSTLFGQFSSGSGSAGFLANAPGLTPDAPYGGVVILPGAEGADAASVNQAAIIQLCRTLVAVRSARLTAQSTYASYQDAVAGMTLVTTQIEALLPDAADASYAALRDLKLAVVADITARAADLKIITHYTPGETLPALVIAHALYGSADLEANVDDLVARNQIQNPGAVPGGRALEVLTP